MSGSASAASRLNFIGARCMRARVPTISRWLSSSVPMSMSRTFLRVFAVESLDRILHCGGKLAVGSAELFEQHVAEFGIRRVDANRVHQFLHVMVHYHPRCCCGL